MSPKKWEKEQKQKQHITSSSVYVPAIAKRNEMASRTLTDFFQPASKRLKPTLPRSCKSDDANASTLTAEQLSRVEYNKLLAKSKRNLKLCVERVSKTKGNFCRFGNAVPFVMVQNAAFCDGS